MHRSEGSCLSRVPEAGKRSSHRKIAFYELIRLNTAPQISLYASLRSGTSESCSFSHASATRALNVAIYESIRAKGHPAFEQGLYTSQA